MIDNSTTNPKYDAPDAQTVQAAKATQTGDDTNIALYIGLAILALLAAVVAVIPTIRKKFNK